jgi:SpoVK/Ycf46/Vps4 family AAA+-type ATPase
MTTAPNELTALPLPDSMAQSRYEALVGLDDVKRSLATAITVVLKPEKIHAWAAKHGGGIATAQLLINRAPLFILGGDVGTGKTELAESIGDFVARTERMNVLLFRLGLTARGTGLVGEMTQRLSNAFATVCAEAKKWKPDASKRTGAILFIDEADAVAQSRAEDQMHHEDRAGVNALIRAIDDLSRAHLPVAVLMATNRLDSIDPAIRRRAANLYQFERPSAEQRAALFKRVLPHVALSERELAELVKITGNAANGYPFSYSDIVQRVIPEAILAAFQSDSKLNGDVFIRTARATTPTPPFGRL